MPLIRTLFVIAVVFVAFPAYAQDVDDEVWPDCLSFSGILHPGVKGMPYWVKNNDLKAPVGEEGDLFIFGVGIPVEFNDGNLEGKETGPVRVAIYCYTEDEKTKTPKPIPVRTDIDVEKRYVTSRQGGGLMGSMQINESSTVSLFIPHSIYGLEPGEYGVRYKVVAFYTKDGKQQTEEYWIDQILPIVVQKITSRGGKGGVRIVNQIAFSPTDDGLPQCLTYKLLPAKK